MAAPTCAKPHLQPLPKPSPSVKPSEHQRERSWPSNCLGTGGELDSAETDGGEGDDSPWSRGRARDGDSFAPHSGG
jgi:hypothetical protein